MIYFCKFPPDSDPAVEPGPSALTAKSAITLPV
jgi:hypothetical protein